MSKRHMTSEEIIKIAEETLEEIQEKMDEYTPKLDNAIKLVKKYDIRGLYDFTEDSAKMQEKITEEITEMTKKFMEILRKNQVKNE